MPRYARVKSESGIYHVIMRGINKQDIFEDDEDRQRLLDIIQRYGTISNYDIYGYSLMSNHIHLLMKEYKEPLSVALKRICCSYVYWYNRKYNRSGHLFQERYKSEAVENNEYFLTVLRYIHQNPVKAGLVKNIGEYRWSSYNEYISKVTLISEIKFGLELFSDNAVKALSVFKDYMNESINDKCLDVDDRIKLTDSEVREYLTRMGILNITELQHQEKKKRDETIRAIKAINGLSIRQLSRITGISKSVIDRA